MEMEIINKFENKMLNRQEYQVSIAFDAATPKRVQVKDKVSALINSKSNLTIVKKIFTRAGTKHAFAKVHVYDNVEQLSKIEPKYLIERNAKKEIAKDAPEKVETKPTETKKEEKPKKAEVKETPKEEKK